MPTHALIAASISGPLLAGALFLWADRGWLILIDLASVTAHAFCL